MPNFKNEREKRKYYKQKEKEIIKQRKQLDKEVEEEYKRLNPKDHSNISNKLAKKMAEFFDILWPDDEEKMDKEYDELLTPKEKEELETNKKEEKKLLIKGIIGMTTFVTFIVIAALIYGYFNRTHYQKVIAPMIKNYFKEHYESEIDIKNNNYICYEVIDEEKKKKEECTNLMITTTNTSKHVLTINDDYMGDDVNNESIKTSYIADFENTFGSIGIVYDDASISYKDFYHSYNPYLDYMKILPVGMNYNDMKATNKITVEGKVLYQGELVLDQVKNYLSSFSDDSRIFFIKLNQGMPSKFIIATKNSFFEIKVQSSNIISDKNIIFYELDRSINGVSSCEVTDVSTHGIRLSNSSYRYSNRKDEYQYLAGKFIKFNIERQRRDEPAKSKYYILKFTNNTFINNFILFDGSRGSYTELERDQYPLFVYITLGNETYVIGNDDFGIALKTKKKEGFLCNLGLC